MYFDNMTNFMDESQESTNSHFTEILHNRYGRSEYHPQLDKLEIYNLDNKIVLSTETDSLNNKLIVKNYEDSIPFFQYSLLNGQIDSIISVPYAMSITLSGEKVYFENGKLDTACNQDGCIGPVLTKEPGDMEIEMRSGIFKICKLESCDFGLIIV